MSTPDSDFRVFTIHVPAHDESIELHVPTLLQHIADNDEEALDETVCGMMERLERYRDQVIEDLITLIEQELCIKWPQS